MWSAVICSLICFAIATIMFTPQLRSFPCYQSLSFLFLFEGAWNLLNGIILVFWPSSNFMIWVHYVGLIIFGGYFLYCLYYKYWHSKKDK